MLFLLLPFFDLLLLLVLLLLLLVLWLLPPLPLLLPILDLLAWLLLLALLLVTTVTGEDCALVGLATEVLTTAVDADTAAGSGGGLVASRIAWLLVSIFILPLDCNTRSSGNENETERQCQNDGLQIRHWLTLERES